MPSPVELVELLINSGDRLLKHGAMRRRRRSTQIGRRPRALKFQRLSTLGVRLLR